ncbi:hybrid sensor histidine kinase/response regulator [Paraburkholderia phenoliruptrix]|uniref:hybrid sensor histidine kinase/response regulator n=1 Tax=Paraburkholderia phenoliruptrix TaxID=252970 RepID=UPI002869CB5E|nr:ATP-binding protein [Paraburkholderia phenoliruptrix]WMY11729.1 ATP-binding protein [Paraburkholderia phenoliruptrix]
MPLRPGPFPELAGYLESKRGLVTRRWLRAVRSDPAIEQAARLSTSQLLDHLPSIFEQICAVLRAAPDETSPVHLRDNAKKHGRDRWMHGYQLDELYRELDQLQRCVQQVAREFFAGTSASRKTQTAAHRLIEDLFSATIHTAIKQLLEDQDERIKETSGERDRALSAQKQSEERLRMAASAAGLGIFEWHIPTRTGVWENSRMYEITGQPESQGPLSCREFVRELVHADDAQALITDYMVAMEYGGDFHETFRIVRIDDRAMRVVEMYGRFQSAPDGSIHAFIGTLEDITRRTLAEESLREADRRKDAFLATLAHELRNPLAPIRNAAQILGQIVGDMPPEVEWVRATVARQCAHLARLIDDLMDVSRISGGNIRLQREVFDIRQAIQGAVEINLPTAKERRDHIKVSVPDVPLLVNGDRTRLMQALSNLLDNAIKYSDDCAQIAIDATSRDGHVEIVVRDNGVGISPSQLGELFSPYVQLPTPDGRWRPGLGIGLSVVRTLIDMHGGHVTAASDGAGKGSRFTVTLPTVQVSAASTPDAVGLSRRPARRLRVLVVDDNRDAAESLAIILDDHEVRCAFDGESALAMAKEFRADAVILDIALPGINGHEVARQLRALPDTAHAMLVALSGFGAPEDRARSREAGCQQHFTKPVDPGILVDLLNSYAAGHAR